ncbi:MAG: LON peptidase substrate-binding domain-containing protein [Acidimicrobiia bacterium]
METMPMFPLSTVLLPGAVLPLRLFEDRYLEMFDDMMAGDQTFGVVLIERGTESGGDDVRFETGCLARMVGAAPQEDGTIMTVNVGSERLRIVEWLAEDPYPRAMVERLPDGVSDTYVAASVEQCRTLLTTIRALASELGSDVGDAPELSDDPIRATYQLAHIAPLQSLDQQRLLEIDDPLTRAETLRRHLEAILEMLRLELAMGS